MKGMPGRSLRSKLVLTSVLLLVVMLAALAANSLRLMEDALIEQARLRARLSDRCSTRRWPRRSPMATPRRCRTFCARAAPRTA